MNYSFLFMQDARREGRAAWKRWFLVAALAVVGPAYVIAFFAPAAGFFHDDGIYIVTAKALAEGRGYRIISLPSEPRQTKYPPVFPLLLAVVWTVFPSFPENVLALKLVPLAAACIWLVLTVKLLRALGLEDSTAWLIAFATAASPWVLYLSTTAMSETLFSALCFGTLLYLERGEPGPKRAMTAGLLAGLAILTRMMGIALIPGCAAWMISKRRYSSAAAFTAVALAMLLPWMLWANAGAGYYSSEPYKSWHVFSSAFAASWAQKAAVIGFNLLAMVVSPAVLLTVPVTIVTGLATFLLVAWGLSRCLRRNHATLWFVACYVAVAACWMWPPHRFMATVLPLVLWLSVQVLSKANSKYRFLTVIALLLLAAPAIRQLYRNAGSASENGVLPIVGESERWAEVEETCRWVRANTRPDAVIAGNLDPLYFLLTGRKAVRGFAANPLALFYWRSGDENPITTPAALLGELSAAGASVFVESPDYFFAERKHLTAPVAELEKQGRLKPAHVAGQFRIFTVQHEGGVREGRTYPSPER